MIPHQLTAEKYKRFVVGDLVFFVNERHAEQFNSKLHMSSYAIADAIINRKTDAVLKCRWLVGDVFEQAFMGTVE